MFTTLDENASGDWRTIVALVGKMMKWREKYDEISPYFFYRIPKK
jgi:hypothetical protein